jgi:hypothetical protein
MELLYKSNFLEIIYNNYFLNLKELKLSVSQVSTSFKDS